MTRGPWHTLKAAITWLDEHAGWLLVGGLIAAIVVNWRQWRKDKRAIQRLEARPIGPPVLNETPRVSILVPAWNEADNIGPCIESILALRYPDKELVVCAGGDDGTLDIARRYTNPRVIVLEQYRGEGKQRALQQCFEQATGDIIFLTDADCLLDDDPFERTVEPLLSGEEEVTTGSWKPLDKQLTNPFVIYQWSHHLYREGVLPEYVDSLDGRNAAIRRSALERIGGFSVTAPIGTDYQLANQLIKAGYRIRFVRDSRVRTEYPETVRQYWKQQSRWFRNALLLSARFGAWKRVLTSARAGLAALFMLGIPLTGGMNSKLLWYLWLAAVWHLILSQARFTRFAQLRGGLRLAPRWRYALFAPYMVVGWIAMARGLADSLLPWRRGKW